MKIGIKTALAFSIALVLLVSTPVFVNCISAQSIIPCDCGSSQCSDCVGHAPLLGKRGCQHCGRIGRCSQCPGCEGDICQLELDQTPVKKTCFKVELKTICIPAVRLPWKKCCPPAISRTRQVCVLKKHSYECPHCSYQWNVVKPEVFTTLQDSTENPAPLATQPAIPLPPGVASDRLDIAPIPSNPPPIVQANR